MNSIDILEKIEKTLNEKVYTQDMETSTALAIIKSAIKEVRHEILEEEDFCEPTVIDRLKSCIELLEDIPDLEDAFSELDWLEHMNHNVNQTMSKILHTVDYVYNELEECVVNLDVDINLEPNHELKQR